MADQDFGALRALYHRAEPEVLQTLLPNAGSTPEELDSIRARARGLIAELRAGRHLGWIDRFLHEYGLNSEEGVALLGLAEAYLRVPDAFTADRLVQDKIGPGDWRAHAGASPSLRVNGATLGLMLTRYLVDEAEGGPVRRLVHRMGEPAVRAGVAAAMQRMGEQFVLGRDIDEGLKRSRKGAGAMFRYSFDMLGEGARTRADAADYQQAYLEAIAAVGRSVDKEDVLARDTVSVKLSALHPRYEPLQADRCVPELTAQVLELARAAKAAGIGLTIDAEEADRLEMSLRIIAAVMADPGLKDWEGLGMAVQAYQRRASAVVVWADALSHASGKRMTVRLVKGAYWDTEIKRAQEQGLGDYPVFTRKAATDVSYLACARALLGAPHLYPAFATHNALTVATIMEWAGARRDFEFQRLHGMGVGLYEGLIQHEGVNARVYAPVGGYRDLLAYLVRRLLENGANSSFVNQLADPNVGETGLLADPVAHIREVGGAPHPKIPSPIDLFGAERRNSEGLDLSDPSAVGLVLSEMEKAWTLEASEAGGPGSRPVLDPADQRLVAGFTKEADASDCERALALAAAAQPAWAARPVAERAACLDRMADLLETRRAQFMALAVREAGKTLADAVGEVREAVDFCRYYAARARQDLQALALPGPTGEKNELRMVGRGVFLCISPWNFPLAIFAGQVVAALVSGNSVIAKPAPQTPLIARRAVALMHEAGVPKDVLHLLPGGPDVGQALVADRRVGGVAFTGSTTTARRIARTLLEDDARPLSPLIAETGGLNAMIVDSTALPEQVVADVITSAFRSAGQRCSALRLLCLQEEVAPAILQMLQGAMAELRIGDPADPSVDVGPVIDTAAAERLRGHIRRNADRVLASCPLPAATAEGHFVPPTVIRLGRIEDLKEEWFGPILHVVTWRAEALEDVVRRINASGYGLTMGLHSRVGAVQSLVRALANVGNLYVNRSMIGAVVGVQPFGGEGLSGAGPKAGGPHYLHRFVAERTVSIDTTSAGGNASLMAMDA
ncbi:MAG TPA: bifunctional proline dehydrogenase/L-glutamate gamma-semialdehyde dehydrogenase PutA [Caulobacteraceae bacterium]